MEKLGLGDARQILIMLNGGEVASSKLSRRMADVLLQEGLMLTRINGSRCKYFISSTMREACRLFIAQQFSLRCSLEEWIETSGRQTARAELVEKTGNSKSRHVRTFRGFLVNSYTAIDASLNGEPFVVNPMEGSAVFVNDTDGFCIPADVVVVGMENAENFMLIRRQRALFNALLPGRRILFVSRYPQHAISDLRTWLLRICNPYIHFGDFDLAGIHIYLSEFYAYLGERSSFLVPKDIEERLRRGNPALYDQQYAKFKDMKVTDARLLPLVNMIHRHRKGYEQEGYIDIIANHG